MTTSLHSNRARRRRRQLTAVVLLLLAGIGSTTPANAGNAQGGGLPAATWTGAGPVQSLVIDPATPGTIYASTYCSGLLKSLDGGDSWSSVNTGLPNPGTVELAIDPTTPGTLYAGTNFDGVFMSLNGGNSWSAVSDGLPDVGISALAINPRTPTTLYAGTYGSGVFKSLNAGGSWSAVNEGLTIMSIDALVIDPTTPTTIYAGTGGVFKSLNGGGSWRSVSDGLPGYLGVTALAINPATPTILYAGFNGVGVFKSLNGGESWAAAGLANHSVSALVLDPVTPTTLYAAGGAYENGVWTDGVFRSADGGVSWEAHCHANGWIAALAIDTNTPATLYAGGERGVFRSRDAGRSWEATDVGGRVCGDGVTSCGWQEQCDDGGESATCDVDCTFPECGDGVLNVSAGEQCEDGNRNPFDGCTTDCTVCGDGVVTPPEDCDGVDGCDAQCRWQHAVGNGTPQSCTEAALDAGLAEGSVRFNCGSAPVTITVTSEKVITAATAVDGGGRITLSGGGAVRVFSVDPGAALDARNLTIAGGYGTAAPSPHCGGGGGAIDNAGTVMLTNCTLNGNSANLGGGICNSTDGMLTLNNCTLSGNSAARGGGIFNWGTATLSNCTLSGNTAAAGGTGGGIFSGTGTLTLTHCTLSGNSAPSNPSDTDGDIYNGSGGGIFAVAATVVVTNSTLSGNSAARGGGIASYGISVGFGGQCSDVVVTNSTISGNSADAGAGGIEFACPLSLTNSIIANSGGANCANALDDFPFIFTDGGHNLQFPGTSCGETIPSIDPLLDPAGLLDNGGPTRTIALFPGSPAIDAGNPDICGNPPVNGADQRGHARPGTGHTRCSIGAYEADVVSPDACPGDCDGIGGVTVEHVITLVDIALGTTSVAQCSSGDANGDNAITIDEIVAAVNMALDGCPTGPPFPWEPGPFGVGVRQMVFTKPSATNPSENRVLLTDIWYPAAPDASPIDATLGGVVGAPRAANAANSPLLLFSHGSCGNPEQSRFLTTALASHGFVVAAPPHRGNVLSDFPTFDDCRAHDGNPALAAEREADIRFVIDALLQVNAEPESFFAGAIDPNRIGVAGHSFGGETAQRVCARDPRVRAGLVLASQPAVPGRTIHVPIMVQAGERDGIIPLGLTQLLFQGLRAPKYFVELFHTGHTAFIDDCLVFFPACDGAGPDALTQDAAHRLVQRYAVPFLLHHVGGDGRFDAYLGPAQGAAFTTDTGTGRR